ncbi:hypothetical protein IFM89_030536 [Coptis chinensis]|uniref:Uncharacterized protein n=1 Tax=Coptis chinensis TaxID=261450 RepID=A0A835LNX4_9MAGN|nr:hypothetical protein IFM89_030536 [Coptis chinensis]
MKKMEPDFIVFLVISHLPFRQVRSGLVDARFYRALISMAGALVLMEIAVIVLTPLPVVSGNITTSTKAVKDLSYAAVVRPRYGRNIDTSLLPTPCEQGDFPSIQLIDEDLEKGRDFANKYGLVSSETRWLGLRMVLKSVAAAVWTAAFVVIYVLVWRWSSKAEVMQKVFLIVVHVYLLPETRIFVGCGLSEGIVDSMEYSVFWILILAAKCSFSFYFQIMPMVEPTKAVWKLKRIDYDWLELFGITNILAVGLLWLPVLLICLMDIQRWYSIFSSLVGSLVGYLTI